MTPNEGTQRIPENGILNCFEGFRNETVGTVFKNLEMSHLNFHPKKWNQTLRINVARFARNVVRWDFFCDFQTPWAHFTICLLLFCTLACNTNLRSIFSALKKKVCQLPPRNFWHEKTEVTLLLERMKKCSNKYIHLQSMLKTCDDDDASTLMNNNNAKSQF